MSWTDLVSEERFKNLSIGEKRNVLRSYMSDTIKKDSRWDGLSGQEKFDITRMHEVEGGIVDKIEQRGMTTYEAGVDTLTSRKEGDTELTDYPGEWVKSAWSGLNRAGAGVARAIGDATGSETISDWAAEKSKEYKQKPGEGVIAQPGSIYSAVNMIGETVTRMVPALGLGIATGGTAAAGILAADVWGNTYNDQREAGMTPAISAAAATGHSLAEFFGERYSIGKLLEPSTGILKKALKMAGVEGIEEGVTAVLQEGINSQTIDTEMTWTQAWPRIMEQAALGMASGPIMSVGVDTTQKILGRNEQQPEKTPLEKDQPIQPDFNADEPPPPSNPNEPPPPPTERPFDIISADNRPVRQKIKNNGELFDNIFETEDGDMFRDDDLADKIAEQNAKPNEPPPVTPPPPATGIKPNEPPPPPTPAITEQKEESTATLAQKIVDTDIDVLLSELEPKDNNGEIKTVNNLTEKNSKEVVADEGKNVFDVEPTEELKAIREQASADLAEKIKKTDFAKLIEEEKTRKELKAKKDLPQTPIQTEQAQEPVAEPETPIQTPQTPPEVKGKYLEVELTDEGKILIGGRNTTSSDLKSLMKDPVSLQNISPEDQVTLTGIATKANLIDPVVKPGSTSFSIKSLSEESKPKTPLTISEPIKTEQIPAVSGEKPVTEQTYKELNDKIHKYKEENKQLEQEITEKKPELTPRDRQVIRKELRNIIEENKIKISELNLPLIKARTKLRAESNADPVIKESVEVIGKEDILKDENPLPTKNVEGGIPAPISISDIISNIDKEDLKKQEALESDKAPHRKIADKVYELLNKGKAIPSKTLVGFADEAHGGTQGESKYTVKDMNDSLELGVNLYLSKLQDLGLESKLISADSAVYATKALKTILSKLPTQTKRTGGQDEFQQFSTPPTYAYVANWLAKINDQDVMLEPSAGIGGLAIFAKQQGAKVIVNELDPRRLAHLKELGFDREFNENAEQIHNILPKDVKPTVVVMNPPFSATAGRIHGKRDTNVGARHIEQALKRLEPGGRLVAIVGQGMAADRPAFTKWWNEIKKEYNVKANVGVDGKGYVKYGTTFDNNILVIDKTGPTTKEVITGKFDDITEIIPLLEGVRNERLEPTLQTSKADKQPSDKPVLSKDVKKDKNGDIRDDVVQPPVDVMGVGVGGGKVQPEVSGTDKGSNTKVGEPSTKESDGIHGSRGDTGGSKLDTKTAKEREQPAGSSVVTTGESKQPNVDEDGRVSLEGVKTKSSKEALTDSIFSDYTPQKLKIKGAKKHPGKLVQSAAMADIEPPNPTYRPKIPQELINDGSLSIAQLEAIVYAGQAHEQTLPNGKRKGFFIGDGTGVGKGREISGIILDNFMQGRKKAIWVSETPKLFKDAQRDFSGLKQDGKKVFEVSKTKADLEIKNPDGIAFISYPTLRGGSKEVKENSIVVKEAKSRIDQIVEWAGKDFDGVIAFDEAHNMANNTDANFKQGSRPASLQALAGIELSAKLPNARVVYVSATGATEVSNLGYADRLGLWGEGTPFSSREKFVSEISSGGIAAMELVARDMKGLGVYLARSLSYDDVTYERIEHIVTPQQEKQFDEMARAWQIVLENIDAALLITEGDAQAKSRARSQFWMTHQRFFNQILTSMQMPTIIKAIHKDLVDGKAPVLQLVNTNEATQERKLSQMEQGDSLDDLDLTPLETLLQFVENSFPVAAYESYLDENGNTHKRIIKTSEGAIVESSEAVAMREALLDKLGSMKVVPEGPLEMLINEFGSGVVAEVTGRKRRVVRVNGKAEIQKRSAVISSKEADEFMDGKRSILVFSEAGGTGRSYHADNTRENKKQRAHYLVQAGWRADKVIQGLGRSHRTNQASAPHIGLAMTNLPGHKRFISSIAKRLGQIGALTKGSRKTGNQGIFNDADDLESTYAADAIERLFIDVFKNKIPAIDIQLISKKMGINLVGEDGNFIAESVPDVTKFLNRLLSLEISDQNKVFDAFLNKLTENIEAAREAGTFDVGLENLVADKVDQIKEEVVYTHPESGAETKYVELELTHPQPIRNFPGKGKIFYKNIKSGRLGFSTSLSSRTDSTTGEVIQRVRLSSPTTDTIVDQRDIENSEKYEKVVESEAKKQWDETIEITPKTFKEKKHLITGAILPIWDRIKGHSRIIRTQTEDGKRMIGRLINPQDLASTLESLGASSSHPKVTGQEAFSKIIDKNYTFTLSNGWRIKRSRVTNENRIEVTGPEYGDIDSLRKEGVFTERIQFKTRFFIPIGSEGIKTFDAVTKYRPITTETPPFNSKDDSALRRGNSASNYTKSEAEAVVNQIKKTMKNAPPIVVVEKESELPTEVQDKIKREGAQGDVKGVLHKGTVYIVTSNIGSNEDVQLTLIHEVIGHWGVNETIGKDLLPLLKQVATSYKGKGLEEIAKRWGYDLNTIEGQIATARELLAVMAETNEKPRLLQRIYSKIREWLRKAGFTIELNDNDLARILSNSRKFAESGGIVRGENESTQFSRGIPTEEEVQANLKKAPSMVQRVFKRAGLDKQVFDPRIHQKLGTIKKLLGSTIHIINDNYTPEIKKDGKVIQKEKGFVQGKKFLDLVRNWHSEKSSFMSWTDTEIIKPLNKLKSPELKNITDVLVNETLSGKRLTDNKVVEALKGNEEVIHIYHKIRTYLDSVLDRHFEQISKSINNSYSDLLMSLEENEGDKKNQKEKENQLMDELKETLHALKAEKDSVKKQGYFPLSRFGDEYVLVKSPEGELLARYHTESKTILGFGEQRDTTDSIIKKIKSKYPKDTKFEKGTIPKQVRDNPFLASLSPSTLGILAKHNIALTNEQKEAINLIIKDKLSDRSFLQHMRHQAGYEGFSRDIVRVLASYSWHAENRIARLGMEPAYARIKNSITKSQAKAYPDVIHAIDETYNYLVDPKEEFTALRGGMFLYFLGWAIASGALNLMQSATATFPVLSSKFGDIKTGLAMTKAKYDIGKIGLNPFAGMSLEVIKGGKYGFEGLTVDESLFLQEGLENGTLAEKFSYEMIGQAEGNMITRHQISSQFLNKSAFLFGAAESFNRFSDGLAAYRLAKKSGMSIKDSKAYAYKVVDKTHFQYAKWNRPKGLRGIGAPLFMFKQFPTNFVKFLVDQPNSVRFRSLAMIGLLSGLHGLPFAENILDVIKGLMSLFDYDEKDLEEEMHNIIIEATGSVDIANAALHGLGRGLNSPFDMGGSIGMGDLIPFTGLLPGGRNSSGSAAREIMGSFAPTGLATKVLGGASKIGEPGGTIKGLETMAPRGLGNIAKGARWLIDGKETDRSGATIFEPTVMESLLKMGSFIPAKLMKKYEELGHNYRATDYRADIKGGMVARMVDAYESKNIADRREKTSNVFKEIMEYNKKVRTLGGGLSLLIKPAEVISSARSKIKRVTKANRTGGIRVSKRSQNMATNAHEIYGAE